MRKEELIICPKCNFKNIKLTKKCTKCGYDLDKKNKVCSKCGKIKSNNVKKCDCGFDFTKKRMSILFGVILSVGVMILLSIIYIFSIDLWNKISMALKVLFLFVVFVMIVKSITTTNYEVVHSDEIEMLKRQKSLSKMKKISKLAVVIGGILSVLFLIYYYFIR